MQSKKTVIMMGNGPSLGDVDFDLLKNYDTYGLNSAYRAYERMNWYPKYSGKKGLEKGLEKTIQWFSKNENLKLYKHDIYNI